jgi:hypothetical protein
MSPSRPGCRPRTAVEEEPPGAPSVRRDSQPDLDHEQAEEQIVQQVERRAVLAHQAVEGLKTEHERVREHHAEHGAVERRMRDEESQSLRHRSDTGGRS